MPRSTAVFARIFPPISHFARERGCGSEHRIHRSGRLALIDKEAPHVNYKRSAASLLISCASLTASLSANADPFVSPACHAGDPLCAPDDGSLAGTPFAGKDNASTLTELARGKTVKRSLADGSATPQDQNNLHALEAQSLHAGVVLMHKIPKRNDAQAKKMQHLAQAVDGFAPSGACDAIVREGNGTGMCAGTADGPVGKVPVRMPFATRLSDGAGGSLHLAIWNPRPMEAKSLFSWTPLVSPDHLKMQVDMYPVTDGWLVYTRIAVNMREHHCSAKQIAAALEKLDRWLVSDLSR